MRADNSTLSASVVYIVLLNCLNKRATSTSLSPAPCAVPTAWGLTKLKLLIAVGVILTALFPAEVVNLLSVVSRGRDRWRVAVVR